MESLFSPTPSHENIKLFLSLCAIMKLRIRYLDINSAYLHSTYPIDIVTDMVFAGNYYKQGCQYKINRAIYGLKESSSLFNDHLVKIFEKYGFQSMVLEPTILINKKLRIIILLFVDDILIASDTDTSFLVNKLEKNLTLKDMGINDDFKFLSYDITQKTGELRLSIKSFLENAINRYGISITERKYSTPLDKGFKTEDQSSPLLDTKNIKLYEKIIGFLNYIYVIFRFDIGYSLNQLSRKVKEPRTLHLKGCYRIIQFLYHTRHHELLFTDTHQLNIDIKDFYQTTTSKNIFYANYKPRNRLHVSVVADSSLGNEEGMKSQQGYIVYLNNNVIGWNTKTQTEPSLSSCESEYKGYSEGVKTGLGIINLLNELKLPVSQYMNLIGDNQGALELCSHKAKNSKSRHIQLKYHFQRYYVQNGFVKLYYVQTGSNVADIMTKLLDTTTYNSLTKKTFIVKSV